MQIIVSVVLVAVILIQQGGAAMGSAFGQGDEFHSEKRGVEKNLHTVTIIMGVVFIALAVLNLTL